MQVQVLDGSVGVTQKFGQSTKNDKVKHFWVVVPRARQRGKPEGLQSKYFQEEVVPWGWGGERNNPENLKVHQK